MIWIVLMIALPICGVFLWCYAMANDLPSLMVPFVFLMVSPIFIHLVERSYEERAKETAPFTTQEISIQETANGMQYIEYGDEIINVNDYFGKSFEVDQEIYVNEYEENSYKGANSAPYWKLVENLDSESKNAN